MYTDFDFYDTCSICGDKAKLTCSICGQQICKECNCNDYPPICPDCAEFDDDEFDDSDDDWDDDFDSDELDDDWDDDEDEEDDEDQCGCGCC